MMSGISGARKSQDSYRKWLGTLLAILASGCAASPDTASNPTTATPVVKHLPRPGKGFPRSEVFYPQESKRLGEFGGSNVHICVDAKGVLTEAPTLAMSSGFERLDQAALALAAAGSGHYLPATENRTPVPDCTVFKVWFGPPGRR